MGGPLSLTTLLAFRVDEALKFLEKGRVSATVDESEVFAAREDVLGDIGGGMEVASLTGFAAV